jgi:wobble nucleotide-excising tRNase
VKKKFDSKFFKAFAGSRNSAANFKERLLLEANDAIPDALSLEELEKKAETVFGDAPQMATVLGQLNSEALLAHESNPILKKKIFGKTDVDIAALILKLGNSDWVKKGRHYYDLNAKICPFCQQATDEKLEENLNSYFDEAFEVDTQSIKMLYADYKSDAERLEQAILALLDTPSTFIDAEALQLGKDLLDANIQLNLQRIDEKKRELSKTVELEPLNNICRTIQTLVESANVEIRAHNEMVANLDTEKKTLIKQVWKYLIENQIDVELSSYIGKKRGLTTAINALKQQLEGNLKVG